MTDPLESILDQIAATGLLVSNLFQCQAGGWQANVRDEHYTAQFGLGPTMVAALEAALGKWNEGARRPLTRALSEPRTLITLASLGLAKTTP